MNFTNMNHNSNYTNTTSSFSPFGSMQTQTMPSPFFGGAGGGRPADRMGYQGNNSYCYPSCNTTSTMTLDTLPTPMDYEVYASFMDYRYETDIGINIDDYNLVQRLAHLKIDEDDPMEIDDDPMDCELL